MDQSLLSLVEEEVIDADAALDKAIEKETMRKDLGLAPEEGDEKS